MLLPDYNTCLKAFWFTEGVIYAIMCTIMGDILIWFIFYWLVVILGGGTYKIKIFF
jgi:hypothetical protein